MSFGRLGDVRRVRTALLVADLGSVSAAADALGYTQSAVSQQLAALERELGLRLIERGRRPLRLTADGAALRPALDRLLQQADAVEATTNDLRGGRAGRLRLAAFPSALSTFVPPALRALRREQPDLVVEVLESETEEALDRLRTGAADLALVHLLPGTRAEAEPGLERRRVLVDPLLVVLPSRHRLARRTTVPVAELDGERLVLPRRDTPGGRFRAVVERICGQAGFAPHAAYETDDLQAAQAFAAAGLAAVLMHRLTVTPPRAGVALRPLDGADAFSRIVEAVAPAGRAVPAARALLTELTREAGAVR